MFDSPIKKKYSDIYFQAQSRIEAEYQKHIMSLNKFSIALDALEESFHPNVVVCRQTEANQIEDFILRSLITNGSSESLYISGVPGIGKTLTTRQVVNKICKEKQNDCFAVYTNALTVKNPNDIFKAIYYEFTKEILQSKGAMYKLTDYFERGTQLTDKLNDSLNKKRKKILIIDEIDYLNTKNQEVLYNIFQWTQKKKSNLIIIAISNTFDFPQTLSQKISSRIGNQRLIFKPYTSSQLDQILRQRIGHLNVFEDNAINYICKKIAQISSDVRKCLSILRQSINEFMIQQQIKKQDKKKKDSQNKLISVDLLAKVQNKIYSDNFVLVFNQFPTAYKFVLYVLAKHYKAEARTCTMRQLQHISSSFIKCPSHLRPVIADLRDMGIIQISFVYSRNNNLTNRDFINMKQLNQEHISLLIDYERILYALQRQDHDQLDFRIDLNF